MEISKEHFNYLKSIEITQKKKLKDAFFFQVAEIANKIAILHVKDYFEQSNRYFIEASVKAEFETEEEARKCIRMMKERLAI